MKYLFFYIISLLLIAGCAARISNPNIITITGSDTMFELTSNLADAYMREHPGISIHVKGGGSAVGIKALIKGETDICTASRNLKPNEAKQLADYYSTIGIVYLIALDGLSIYVHPDNELKNFTMHQLKDIYTGKISNWKELGGTDDDIILVSRNPNSGTYLYFMDLVLEGEPYGKNAIYFSTTNEIVNFVSQNKNAIGYGGMGYSLNVYNASIEGIEPVEKNVINNTYPIKRYLHFITAKSSSGNIKSFINWVLSPSGQSIVRNSGYIPLWENEE